MAFWDWLWGKKSGDGMATVYNPPPPPPGMQHLQLSAPAAVPATYDIQRAIELMRALPMDDDPALVLRVVRKTLTSTGVSLEEIIVSAKNREGAVVKGIESDRAAIEQLEIQIATRKANIIRLEADLGETQSVRDRLEEALRSETKVGPAISPDDMMQIRAEAARKAEDGQKSAVPPPPPSSANARPTPPAPPPRKAAPAIVSKPPPKLPSAVASPPKRPESRKPEPHKEPQSSLPDLGEIDDAFDEPTAKCEVPTVGERNDK